MDTHTTKFKIRLGLFITGGLVLFVLAIFIIGKQKNMFNPVFKLCTTFYNVSGLQVGNNIRFSGINVGTVNNIKIINDSTVRVDMLIKKEVQKFIKSDCEAGIGSSGLIGDRILVISQGSTEAPAVKDGQHITAKEPVETDAIMESLSITAANAEIISAQLAEIMVKVNSGKGTIGRLIQDTAIAENLSQTMVNIKKSSKGLDENMQAAKHNFLLKGFFNKKAKAAAKTKDSIQSVKDKQQKIQDKKNK
jgi:phospholipid/cholesterol/gamma-HCH transport system substrate-binding protein